MSQGYELWYSAVESLSQLDTLFRFEKPRFVPPPRTLSRLQLTVLLLVISLVPPIFVVSMVATHRPPKEPMLLVEVSQSIKLHQPRNDRTNPRLLPSLVVMNPTNDDWRNVAISLNKQFFYYHPGTFHHTEEVSIPLEFFVTKGGNVAFQPGSETVNQVTVYAQIPTGARAVSENYFDKGGQRVER